MGDDATLLRWLGLVFRVKIKLPASLGIGRPMQIPTTRGTEGAGCEAEPGKQRATPCLLEQTEIPVRIRGAGAAM